MNDLANAFGSAVFFRMLLPGLILTIGIHPFIASWRGLPSLRGVYPGGQSGVFFAEVVGFGLVAYAATTPVYQCAQGLILSWMTRPARWLNERKFDAVYSEFEGLYDGKEYRQVPAAAADRMQRLYVYLSDYPIEHDEDGIPRFAVRHATTVGNISATYERYPDSRYGVNGEAYWEHLLLFMSDEAVKELDSNQAVAMGTLLACTAGWLTLVIATVSAVAMLFGDAFPSLTVGALPVDNVTLAALAVYGGLSACLFNYLACVAHRQYGRLYRACVDVHIKEFAAWLAAHDAPLSPSCTARAEEMRGYLVSLYRHPSEAE